MKNFTQEIPSDAANLSPSLAALAAVIMMPQQYARFAADATINLNESCPCTVRRIEK